MVELSGRQQKTVRQVVIHAAQAGRAVIADPANLHGCRFTGKSQQAMVPRVIGQVEQDVDAISADFFRQCGVAEVQHRMPVLHIATQALRDAVVGAVVGIGVQRQAGISGQMRQHRLDKIGHRVVA